MTLNAFNGEVDDEFEKLKEVIRDLTEEVENLSALVVKNDDRFGGTSEEEEEEEDEDDEDDDDDKDETEFVTFCIGVDLELADGELRLKKKKIALEVGSFIIIDPDDPNQNPDDPKAPDGTDSLPDCDDSVVPVEPCP